MESGAKEAKIWERDYEFHSQLRILCRKRGQQMNQHYVAWWNVENLFSVKNDPDRSDKLERALGKELNGWTASVLTKKLGQLASIIKQMNAGNGSISSAFAKLKTRKCSTN